MYNRIKPFFTTVDAYSILHAIDKIQNIQIQTRVPMYLRSRYMHISSKHISIIKNCHYLKEQRNLMVQKQNTAISIDICQEKIIPQPIIKINIFNV